MLSTALTWVVLLVALAPLAYYFIAMFAAWDFFRRPPAASPDFTPPVSILKPVRGLDPQAYENFASFCRQDYPEYELLFCVAAADDPAVSVIEQIIRDFPGRSVRLIVGAEELGPSGKINHLARLLREARHDVVVLSDSDIRVLPGYLREVVAPLHDPAVGAVTSMYVGLAAPQFWSELEALGHASDFFAGVLVARKLEGVKFALGASIATTRARIEEIGGFAALADCYVDDYELGHRIAARGHRIELAPSPVATIYPPATLREFLVHQLRWALTVRHSRPGGHAGLVFTQGLPWAVAAAVVAPGVAVAAAYLVAYAVLRVAMAWTVGVWGLKDPAVRRKWWLLPLRDALWFLTWLASFFTSRIRWRGQEFRLHRGRLIPLS